jgi:hypothetical protein
MSQGTKINPLEKVARSVAESAVMKARSASDYRVGYQMIGSEFWNWRWNDDRDKITVFNDPRNDGIVSRKQTLEMQLSTATVQLRQAVEILKSRESNYETLKRNMDIDKRNWNSLRNQQAQTATETAKSTYLELKGEELEAKIQEFVDSHIEYWQSANPDPDNGRDGAEQSYLELIKVSQAECDSLESKVEGLVLEIERLTKEITKSKDREVVFTFDVSDF